MEKKERFVFHDLIIFSELLESINCKLDDTFFAQFHKWPKSDSFWWRFRANEYYKIFQFNLHTLLTWTLLSMSVVEFSTSDMFTSIDDIFCTYLKKKEMCPFFFSITTDLTGLCWTIWMNKLGTSIILAKQEWCTHNDLINKLFGWFGKFFPFSHSSIEFSLA